MSEKPRTTRSAAEHAGEATERVQLRLEVSGLPWSGRAAALLEGDGFGGETIRVGTPEEVATWVLALPTESDERHAQQRRKALEPLTGPVPEGAPNCARWLTRGDVGDWFSGWLVSRWRRTEN